MNRIRTVVGTWVDGEPFAVAVFLASPRPALLPGRGWSRRVIAGSTEEAFVIAERLVRENTP